MALREQAPALRDRAQAMLERVSAEALRIMSAEDAAMVRRAVYAGLLARDRALDDDHDPRLLAPGRVVRILIADAHVTSAAVLSASALIDSVDAHFASESMRPEPAALLDAVAARLCAQVPLPGGSDDDDLLERLVVAPIEAALIAVTERLDQARHLHLRPALPWRAFHAQVRAVYVPAAQRADALIARRLERWADAFERRLLLQDR
jgi:hypothetical protein